MHSRLPISDELVRMLSRKVPNDPQRRTYTELIVQKLIRKAIMGELGAIKEIFDRTEGRASPAPKVRPREEQGEPPVLQVIYDPPQPKSEPPPVPKIAG